MSAQQLFNAIFNVSLVLMMLTLVASLGMGFSVKQVLAPLNRVWLLVGTVVVNSALAPLVAIAVCHLLPLHSKAAVGVELACIAAAGPAVLKAAELAKRANMAMAVSFTIVLQLVNLVVAPLWAKGIATGAKVNPWSILFDLLILVLIPLTVGLIIYSRYPEQRDGWKASLEKISNIALYVAVGVGLAVNWKLVISVVGSWVILASLIIIAVTIAMGWAVGFRNRQDAITISMVSSMRFTPIGLIVISTVLHNQGAYLAPALVFSLFGTIVPFMIAAEIGRLVSSPRTQPAPGVRAAAAGAPQAAATPPSTA